MVGGFDLAHFWLEAGESEIKGNERDSKDDSVYEITADMNI